MQKMLNDTKYIAKYIQDRRGYEYDEEDLFPVGTVLGKAYYIDLYDRIYVISTNHKTGNREVYGYETQTCPKQYVEENGQIVPDKYVDFAQLDYGERFQTPSGLLNIKVNLDDKVYNAAYSKDGDFVFCHFQNDEKVIRLDKE